MKTLLFVDTNILLDFYRVRDKTRIEFLTQLGKVADRLICTYQVEMEFKKNRQAAIIEGSQNLKAPNSIPRPPILSEDRSYGALAKDLKKAADRVKALNARLDRILEDPVRNDPVYKVMQRIFRKTDDLSLHRGTKTARTIRHLAWKRFVLGYAVDDIDTDSDPIEVRFSYHASGEQLDDKAYYGTEIRGEATMIINRDGSVEFTSVSAEKDDEADEPDRSE